MWLTSRIGYALAIGLLLSAFFVAAVRAIDSTASTAAIQVGKNVRITALDGERGYADVTIHGHPGTPHQLLMCGIAFWPDMNKRTSVAYASADDGRTWKKTFESDPAENPSDPICELTADGIAYNLVSPRIFSLGREKLRMYLYRSADAGQHWEQVCDLPYTDLPSLTVDSTHGVYHGRVYIHGTGYIESIDGAPPRRKGVLIWRSPDQGHTFQGPAARLFLDRDYTWASSNGVLLPDGTWVTSLSQLHSYYTDDKSDGLGTSWDAPTTPGRPNAALQIVRSTNGGETISGGVKVDDWYFPNFKLTPSTTGVSALAADTQSATFRNSVYVVWPDVRSGRVEIRFSYSRDGGRTWARSVVVNDDHDTSANARDHLQPMIAVNSSGVIGVAWYDRRDAPDNFWWMVRFTASLDGGETFLPSVPVSAEPHAFRVEDRIFTSSYLERRDYVSFSVGATGFPFNGGAFTSMTTNAAGDFYPVWIDNRTGVNEAWTAPIHVNGQVTRYGDQKWSSLVDVSARMTMELTEHSFHLSDGSLVIKARLRNDTSSPVCKPIVFRAVTLQSWSGTPSAANTDNGVVGPGAAWNFDDTFPKACLANQEWSGIREFRFRLTNIRYPNESISASRTSNSGLLKLEGRILGTLAKGSGP